MITNGFTNNGMHAPMDIALHLMKEIVRRESTDELLFDYLKVIAKREKHKELLDTMIKDERVQFNTLKHIYYHISGSSLIVDAPTFEIPEDFEEGVKDILIRKTKIVKLFTQLLFNLPPQYTPLIYPFIVDEQTHMHLLNFILIDGRS